MKVFDSRSPVYFSDVRLVTSRRKNLIRRHGRGVWLDALLYRRLYLQKCEYGRHVFVGKAGVCNVVHQRETVRTDFG